MFVTSFAELLGDLHQIGSTNQAHSHMLLPTVEDALGSRAWPSSPAFGGGAGAVGGGDPADVDKGVGGRVLIVCFLLDFFIR